MEIPSQVSKNKIFVRKPEGTKVCTVLGFLPVVGIPFAISGLVNATYVKKTRLYKTLNAIGLSFSLLASIALCVSAPFITINKAKENLVAIGTSVKVNDRITIQCAKVVKSQYFWQIDQYGEKTCWTTKSYEATAKKDSQFSGFTFVVRDCAEFIRPLVTVSVSSLKDPDSTTNYDEIKAEDYFYSDSPYATGPAYKIFGNFGITSAVKLTVAPWSGDVDPIFERNNECKYLRAKITGINIYYDLGNSSIEEWQHTSPVSSSN
jgi:hypothetical protein